MTNKKVKKEAFAKRLRILMEEYNENTYTIGDIINMSNSTVSRYLNLEMSPKITTIKILAQYFGVNPVWLMGYDVDKYINKVQERQEEYYVYSKNEKELIEMYRQLNEKQKARLEGIIEGMLMSNNDNEEQKESKKGA